MALNLHWSWLSRRDAVKSTRCRQSSLVISRHIVANCRMLGSANHYQSSSRNPLTTPPEDMYELSDTGYSFIPTIIKWAASSEFVSSSIPTWQILTAHAQPFRGARDLAFCLKVPLDSLLVWASSEGSGDTARMRRLAWTLASRIGDKYQIRLTRPK